MCARYEATSHRGVGLLAIEQLEVSFEDKSLRFTVSGGVAQLDPLRGSWESTMRRADRSMDEAKENGRNAVRFAAGIRNATHVEVEMTSL